jgi:hypothetical protein
MFDALHRAYKAFTSGVVPAHDVTESHRYTVHYPDHQPRQSDPHYKDFEAYRRRTKATAKCSVGEARGDFTDCQPGPNSWPTGLELHHDHVEFALENAVDLALLDKVYPGVSNPDEVGAWVESADNLVWLCTFHHRGHGGVHVASSSDYEAERFIKGLIS